MDNDQQNDFKTDKTKRSEVPDYKNTQKLIGVMPK